MSIMQSINISNIRQYCKNKSIIIVGNSSNILNSNNGAFIDSHDIIVRMNYAYPVNPEYYNAIGKKTNIYIANMSRSTIVERQINKNNLNFILRLTPWGEPVNSNILYQINIENYNKLKIKFGEYKPSTGALTINFFKENIDYKLVNIIGFDFFLHADKFKKNEFKSYYYKDHNHSLEKKYILECLNEKTKLIY